MSFLGTGCDDFVWDPEHHEYRSIVATLLQSVLMARALECEPRRLVLSEESEVVKLSLLMQSVYAQNVEECTAFWQAVPHVLDVGDDMDTDGGVEAPELPLLEAAKARCGGGAWLARWQLQLCSRDRSFLPPARLPDVVMTGTRWTARHWCGCAPRW